MKKSKQKQTKKPLASKDAKALIIACRDIEDLGRQISTLVKYEISQYRAIQFYKSLGLEFVLPCNIKNQKQVSA